MLQNDPQSSEYVSLLCCTSSQHVYSLSVGETYSLSSLVRFSIFFCAASDLTDSDNCPLPPLLGWSFLMSFMCLYMRSRTHIHTQMLSVELRPQRALSTRPQGDAGLEGGWMEVDKHSSHSFRRHLISEGFSFSTGGLQSHKKLSDLGTLCLHCCRTTQLI